MKELLTFEESKKQVMLTDDGMAIDTMRGSVYLSSEEVQKMHEWLTAVTYGDVL